MLPNVALYGDLVAEKEVKSQMLANVALCGDLVVAEKEVKSQLGVSCLMSSSPLGVLSNLWALLV